MAEERTGAGARVRPAVTSRQRALARLQRRYERAERASRARASFLAIMSHEIREPMNGVVGMARLLRDTPLDAEQRLYVDSAIESAEALLTIVNDILDLSRIDAGKLELAPVDVDLASFWIGCGCRWSRGRASARSSFAAACSPAPHAWCGSTRAGCARWSST